jgi:hypothetical protein
VAKTKAKTARTEEQVVEVEAVPEAPEPATSEIPEHWPAWRRLVVGLFPTERGGDPPALHAARARFAWIGWSFVGAFVGGVAAASVLLAHYAVPGIPWVLWGLLTGLLLGAGFAFVVAVRSPVAKGGGAFLLLTVPALVFLLPVALVYAAFRGAKGRLSKPKA